MLYPAAKVIIRHKDRYDELLMVKRGSKSTVYYEPAGGRVEYNFQTRTAESLEQCAVREAHEELGVFIDIVGYIGSYYFFWEIDPQKLSVCAVFEAVLTGRDPFFKGNVDMHEAPLESVWVSVAELASNNRLIDPEYVGLEKVIQAYCQRLLAMHQKQNYENLLLQQ